MLFAFVPAYALITLLSCGIRVAADAISIQCNRSPNNHCVYTPAKAFRQDLPKVTVGKGRLLASEYDGAGQGTFLIEKGAVGKIEIKCRAGKDFESFGFYFDEQAGGSELSSNANNTDLAQVHFVNQGAVYKGNLAKSLEAGVDVVVTCPH